MPSPMKPPDMPDDLSWGAPGEMPEGVPFDAAGEMPEIDPAMLGGQMPFQGMDGAPERVPFTEMPQKMSARPYLRRALKLLGNHKVLVVSTVLLSMLAALLPFVYSAAFGPILELLGRIAVESRNWSEVWTLTGSMFSKANQGNLNGVEAWLATPLTFTTLFIIWASAMVLSHVTEFLQTWISSHLERRVLVDIRQQLYDHVQSLSLDFFSGEKTGALMERILTETGGVLRLLTQALLTPVVDVIVLIIAFIYMIGLSWQMTLVAFALGPFALLMLKYTSRKLQQVSMAMMMSGRDLGNELEETISGMSDIQVFNAQPKRSSRFLAASRAAAKYSSEIVVWVYASASGSQIFVSLSTALVLIVGIFWGQRFGLTIAGIIVFVQFVPQVFGPVQKIVRAYTDYQAAVPSVVMTYELLDTKPTIEEKSDAKNLGEVHGHLSFENVTFGYSPMQKVLDRVFFDVREGETVAFVGPIGCGKSTILNLTMRFLDPQSGRITLEGVDIADVTLSSLRDQVSKLSQFPFFLKDSIRENIRLGKADATDKEIEEACRLAHIHDVILDPQKIPKGYETIVDVQVPSGGQKRLIALARCLLRKPEVLLLDEPTENLDADQRNRLIQVIREYAQQPDN
ncbi:MAG: ABC transporter ATP-binding protein/permease, partial [Acidobacteriota bacterium]|nr:ABC transporter ATP-binding protein/permease [Acidobacteriota bacterium]